MSLDALYRGATWEYKESASAGAVATITVTGITGKIFAVGLVATSNNAGGDCLVTIKSASTEIAKWFCNGNAGGQGVISDFKFTVKTVAGENLVVTADADGATKAELGLAYATLTVAI